MEKDLNQILLEIQGQLMLVQTALNHIAAHQSTLLELLVRLQPELDSESKKAVFELIKTDVLHLAKKLDSSCSLFELVSVIDRYLGKNP
jgi:hypothetical protein